MPVRTIIIQMLPINKHPRHLLASRLRHPVPQRFSHCTKQQARPRTLSLTKEKKRSAFYQHIKDLQRCCGDKNRSADACGFSPSQMKSLYVDCVYALRMFYLAGRSLLLLLLYNTSLGALSLPRSRLAQKRRRR